MSRIKKFLFLSFLLFPLIGIYFFSPVYAVSNNQLTQPTTITAATGSFIGACKGTNAVAANTPVCSDVNKQLSSKQNIIIVLIKDAINIISLAVGIASIIIIIISGIKLTTSGGESKKVSEAKLGLIGAVVGIIVVAFAQSIVIFILDKVK